MDRNHRAFDRVHEDLLDLMERFAIDPPTNPPSEQAVARGIFLAIEMAEPAEQAQLVSRIIPEEELAAQRIRRPEFQDVTFRILLDNAERLAVLRRTPEPEQQDARQESIGECIICGEGGHCRAPCNCVYCLSCLRMAIRHGLTSLNAFPPRCCEPFSERTILLARRLPLVHLFRQLEEENSTLPQVRLYCHNRQCTAFIPPESEGRCDLCERTTCQECGSAEHPGENCEQEGRILEDVWEFMDRTGTVNCPGCGIMIQLAEACNHLLCTGCSTHFCYVCGEIWKTCECQLYGDAGRVVPMRDRSGRKPNQYRRARPIVPGAAAEPGLRIPQLRPIQGEEHRGPRAPAPIRRQRLLPAAGGLGVPGRLAGVQDVGFLQLLLGRFGHPDAVPAPLEPRDPPPGQAQPRRPGIWDLGPRVQARARREPVPPPGALLAPLEPQNLQAEPRRNGVWEPDPPLGALPAPLEAQNLQAQAQPHGIWDLVPRNQQPRPRREPVPHPDALLAFPQPRDMQPGRAPHFEPQDPPPQQTQPPVHGLYALPAFAEPWPRREPPEEREIRQARVEAVLADVALHLNNNDMPPPNQADADWRRRDAFGQGNVGLPALVMPHEFEAHALARARTGVVFEHAVRPPPAVPPIGGGPIPRPPAERERRPGTRRRVRTWLRSLRPRNRRRP